MNPNPAFFAADEPPPYTVLHGAAREPLLLLCDHASARLPRALGDLGLDEAARRSHLAVDIGAAAVTRKLSALLAATSVLTSYSRLVVDCNRALQNAEAFLQFSDGVRIPGNQGLSQAQKQARAAHLYWPYHTAVDKQIKRLTELGQPPVIYAIHSFTPVFEGRERPWEVGILWDADARIAKPMMAGLRRARLVVGDNEPYSGQGLRNPRNFTIERHARAAGLAHVVLEIRQDLIADEAGVDKFASILHDIITTMPAAAAAPAPHTRVGS